MISWEERVKQFYVDKFRTHYELEKKASDQNLELCELLVSQGIEVENDIVVEMFLNEHDLGWMKDPQNRLKVPESVLESYDFYTGYQQVKVAKVPVQARDTYAVRAGTPGEGSWLEVFDEKGRLVGAALALIEIISWDDRETIRSKFRASSVLPDWYRMRELSLCFPVRRE